MLCVNIVYMRLAGVRIQTADIASMIFFYKDLLSMEIEEMHDGFVLFSSGLELISEPQHGYAEIKFETYSISPILFRVGKVGSKSSITVNNSGRRILTVEDPDGNIVHIVESGMNAAQINNEDDYSECIAINSCHGYMFDSKDTRV